MLQCREFTAVLLEYKLLMNFLLRWHRLSTPPVARQLASVCPRSVGPVGADFATACDGDGGAVDAAAAAAHPCFVLNGCPVPCPYCSKRAH